jgi:phosphatidylinositol-3-phosphatase
MCPPQVVPFTNFARDMKSDVPRFVWITPGMCSDGHDCPTATADAWLAWTVPMILASDAWKDNGVLFLTWDEGYDSANSVLTIVVRPNPSIHTSKRAYNHYSLLATIEDTLGVGRLGAAAKVAPMTDLMAIS